MTEQRSRLDPCSTLHRAFLVSCVSASLILGVISRPANANKNVLLIIADDVGATDINAYGESETPPRTRALDALASRGVLFRDCWSMPVCSPSRACIFSGRYGFRTGVTQVVNWTYSVVLPEDEVILPEVLDSVGYASGLFGKWHLGNSLNGGALGPNVAGFHHFSGSMRGALEDYHEWSKIVNGNPVEEQRYATSVNVDDAIAWIDEQTAPWFCCVAFNAAHTPIQAPPDDLHSVDLTGIDPNQNPTPFYHAMIEAMDREIGRLLTTLIEQEKMQDTLVIFVGDNGVDLDVVQPPCQGHRVKNSVFQCGVRVPLIIAGQDIVEPGREVTALVDLTDLFATTAEWCGADFTTVVPQTSIVDSVSLVPYLNNPNQVAIRETVYTEVQKIEPVEAYWQSAIRDYRYKFIRFSSLASAAEVSKFFDLENDPFETNDLLTGELTPEEQTSFETLKQAMDDLQNSEP